MSVEGIYLLDANVLIDANRDYYPLSRVPEFWAWLIHQGAERRVAVPIEIYEEIKDGDDDLAKWIKKPSVRTPLVMRAAIDPAIVADVTERGYAPDLTDVEVVKVGRDPFLIARALEDEGRCVVTTEVSKPSKERANRHIPDVCLDLGVKCCDSFTFLRDLDFRTDWDG